MLEKDAEYAKLRDELAHSQRPGTVDVFAWQRAEEETECCVCLSRALVVQGLSCGAAVHNPFRCADRLPQAGLLRMD